MIRTVDMYAEDILKKYEEKARLIAPTRTDIKDACMARFSEETKIIDKEILRKFLGAKYEDDLYKKIENCNPEKFRTIQNFLIKKTSATSKKNLDVIAWLIDFNPRPYSVYRKPKASGIDLGIKTTSIRQEDVNDITTEIAISNQLEVLLEKEKNIEDESKVEKEVENESRCEPKTEVKKSAHSKKTIWAILSVLIVVMMLFYGVNQILNTTKTNDKTHPLEQDNLIPPEQKCMAWAETEFKLADCSQKIHSEYGTKVIPYDKSSFANMKKVNVSMKTHFFAPNNVTPLIWYSKTSNGTFEYFTAAGIHPVSGKTLDDVTKGHVQKYIPTHENDEDSYLKE